MSIKAGAAKEYERRHDEIWPQLRDAIRAAGISNYSLFRRDLQVIGYFECVPDAATALEGLGATDVDRKWTAWLDSLMEEVEDEDGGLIAYQEIWHLE